MNELALFAGVGGGILGGLLLGWRTVCAVEINPYFAGVLCQRQNDGIYPPFPVWDDVRTFDGRYWRGIIDVVSGGFPCQDISCCGSRTGLEGEKSGLWRDMARIIGEVRPRFVFVENSPMLIHRGLISILATLAGMGYDARWGIISARDAIWLNCYPGTPAIEHLRRRCFIVAYDNKAGFSRTSIPKVPREKNQDIRRCDRSVTFPISVGLPEGNNRTGRKEKRRLFAGRDWWSTEPGMVRMVHGCPHRIHRIEALGNIQVPAVVKLAWETLIEGIGGDNG